MTGRGTSVEALQARACGIPTDGPKAAGTLQWDSSALIVVEAGGSLGLGFTCADKQAGIVKGRDAMDVPAPWQAMQHQIRNLGRQGVAATAIAAMGAALWDPKAKLLGQPLAVLLADAALASAGRPRCFAAR